MKSLIIVNPADCIGCRTCEVACVVAHPSEQELNADIFLPRLKVRAMNCITTSKKSLLVVIQFMAQIWLSLQWPQDHSVIAGGYPATNREMRSL